jgi:hypothetical protein
VRKVKKIFKQKEESFNLEQSSEIREKEGIIIQLERDLKVSVSWFNEEIVRV